MCPAYKVVDARARWLGHRLHADVAIAVDPALPVAEATRLADNLRSELLGHLAPLRSATITITTPEDVSVFDLSNVVPSDHEREHGDHHAPAPFVFIGKLAKGTLSIVDTPEGERFRLSLTNYAAELQASVAIIRPNGIERLPLMPLASDHRSMVSPMAPGEPHEFEAELHLRSGGQIEVLKFKMVEPEGHAH